jgi:hypothetical protein
MCFLIADDHALVGAGFARSSKSCRKYKSLPRSLSLARVPALYRSPPPVPGWPAADRHRLPRT